MQKTSVNPEILDQLLAASASPRKAVQVGQAQFFTPQALARDLAAALPRCRATLCDLTCGAGHLLRGAANRDTRSLFGCDLDPAAIADFTRPHDALAADLTQFAPLLHRVRFQTDLMVLNPPWSISWAAEPLQFLDSSLPSVSAAWRARSDRQPQQPEKGVDSTFATLLLALHFLTESGEGFLIANHATVQRLILPSPVASHIWGHLVIPGNPCTGAERGRWGPRATEGRTPFSTSVLYFTRATRPNAPAVIHASLPDLSAAVARLAEHRRSVGLAMNLSSRYAFKADSASLWEAASQEYVRLHSEESARRPHYNLWLASDGTIRTYLSPFDRVTRPDLARQAVLLRELEGKIPVSLVPLRQQRDILLRAVTGSDSPWLVDPKLQQSVRDSVAAYHADRAPLYPLPKIQRLGYLDEENAILCERDLPPFRAGQSYPLTTRSVPITRRDTRYNPLHDCDEQIEYTGSELATFIHAEGQAICFMESRLRDPSILIEPEYKDGVQQSSITVHHTLQELVAHFYIPEVPDISSVRPDLYRQHLDSLAALDALIAKVAS